MSENFAERARGRAASTQAIVQAAGNTASSFLNRSAGGAMFPTGGGGGGFEEPMPPDTQGPQARGGLFSSNGQQGIIRGVPNIMLLGGAVVLAYFVSTKK
jgi:hypothetical protein